MDKIISRYFTFLDMKGNIINDVSNVDIAEDGRFSTLTYVVDEQEMHLSPSEYVYTNLILDVPGIGFARVGDIVTLERYREKAKRYKLHFGWHSNISNQKLFTWYLTQPTLAEGEIREYKTLYYDDLCNILAIEHISPGVIPAESENKYENFFWNN